VTDLGALAPLALEHVNVYVPVVVKLLSTLLAVDTINWLPLHIPFAVAPLAVHVVAALVIVQVNVLDVL
jgi:hypothetical protein